MYQLSIPNDHILPGLQKGEYYVDDHIAGLALITTSNAPAEDRLSPIRAYNCNGANGNLEGLETLIVAAHTNPEGVGCSQLLVLNAIFESLKRTYPGLKVHLAAIPDRAPLCLGFVDRILPYPVPVKLWPANGFGYWLEGTWDPELSLPENSDRLGDFLGHSAAAFAVYEVTDKEKNGALKKFPRSKAPRVGVKLPTQTEPGYHHLSSVMQALGSMGVELVTALGGEQHSVEPPAGIYDCMHEKPAFRTLRSQLAMLATCDVLLTPRGLAETFGAAMDIPVVLIGPGVEMAPERPGTAISWKASNNGPPPEVIVKAVLGFLKG